MSVQATRMNLLASRSSLSLAREGVSLLKGKREALVRDFFKVVDTVMSDRTAMAERLQRGVALSAFAQAFAGRHRVRAAALAARRDIPIRTREVNIWGIKVPEIMLEPVHRPPEARGVVPPDTEPQVMEASEAYEELLEELLRVASYEIRLKRLGEEIRKVSRRINALEQFLIPTLTSEIRQMREALEERERQDRFRLKHIKNKRTRA